MTLPFTIDQAFADQRLFAPALGDLSSWAVWRIVLKAAFGLSLDDDERKVFAAIAGNRAPPRNRVRELWAVCARRSGKSRMAALIGVYLACFLPRRLAAGELGEVAIVS